MDVQFPINNFASTLNATVLVGDTSLTLASGGGNGIPALSGSQYLILTLSDGNSTTAETIWERVKCTTHSANSDTFSGLTRAYDGTTARQWSAGQNVSIRWGVAEANLTVDTASAQTIAGVKTFNDGVFKTNGAARLIGQSSAVAAPSTGEAALWNRLLTSIQPMVLAGITDDQGSTSRDPFGPIQRMSWPTHGSWHLTEYMLGQAYVGYGMHGMNSPTRTTQGTTALSAGSFRGEAAPRITFATAASANSGAGIVQDTNASISNSRGFWRGNAAGRGGFLVSMLFDLTTISTSTGRLFAGLTTSTANPAVQVAADMANADTGIGLGFNDGDTNMTILCSDGTTLAKVPLDTPRTKTQANGVMYWLLLMAAPNGSTIWVYVVEFTSSSYSGTVLMNQAIAQNATVNAVTAKIPGTAVLMRQQCFLSTGTGTGALTLGFVSGMAWSPR